VYQLRVHTSKPEIMYLTKSLLHENIQDEFKKANIEILSPHYRYNRMDAVEVVRPPPSLKEGEQIKKCFHAIALGSRLDIGDAWVSSW
jgi:small-conductance mechanosensitive channel